MSSTSTKTSNSKVKASGQAGEKPKPFPKMSPFRNDLGQEKDRHGAPRKVPMRVLCLGPSRTGTASLTQALKRLGYVHCYHGYDPLLQNASDMKFWLEAKNERCGKKTGRRFTREDFDQLLGHCQAVTDFPCLTFAEELIEAYPEAKIVYTTRDRDTWHKSVSGTLEYYINHPAIPRVTMVGKIFNTDLQYVSEYLEYFFTGYYGGDFRKHGKRVFDEHYELVHRLAPKDNILDWSVKEGWGPLCEFLGDPVPEVEFPYVNDTEEFKAGLRVSAVESGQLPGGALMAYFCIHPVRLVFRLSVVIGLIYGLIKYFQVPVGAYAQSGLTLLAAAFAWLSAQVAAFAAKI